MKHALVLAPFAPPQLERLRQAMRVTHEDWLERGRIHDPEELGRRLRDETVHFLVIEGDFVFGETLEPAADLELIGVCRNGLNQVDVEAATRRGVLVVNAPGRNAVAVAELTVGLMLALARSIPSADRYVRKGRWADPVGGYRDFRGTELAGKTAAIIGLGAVGCKVAKRLEAMEMRVIACDPYVTQREAQQVGAELVTLEAALARADYLLVHAPSNDGTLGMIGRQQLRAMKPSAYLVDTSAPGVVDEAALIEALSRRAIAGAAVDVFEGHPLPESSPLRGLRNVILTPHIGGATVETVERQSAMIAEDILLTLAGERPRRLVNPEAWERRGSPSAGRRAPLT